MTVENKKITKLTDRRLDAFHRLAALAVATNLVYFLWLLWHVVTPLGYVFAALEACVFLVLLVFAYNHWSREYQLLGGSYSLRSHVDVFIPTVDESLTLLRATVAAADAIEYANKTVYILDDGNRKQVKALAKTMGCEYMARPKQPNKKYKSANLNYALARSRGSFVLTIDADNIVEPNIIDDLLGHFKDPSIAIVASRQAFTVEKTDFNHDHLFYNYMQAGKNRDGAAISCGSGVIYRRAALEELGGFSEWNLVEDLHTTYEANQHGYRSIYVTQSYVTGHAPRDLAVVYKQRGTWALDTMRMFIWQQPLFRKGLSVRQKLHYFEIGYCYVVSAFILPAIFLVNFYTLAYDQAMISGGLWYVVFRLPALVATLMLFGRFSQGQLTSRIWAGLFPVYFVASVRALTHPRTKPKYVVTSKQDTDQRYLRLVVPQILFVAVGFAMLGYHLLTFGLTIMFWFSLFWVIVMVYWLSPVVLKAAKLRY